MPDFKTLIDQLYQAVHGEPNARIEAARKLYQELVGAPPIEAETRIQDLIRLNQQLQNQINTTKAAVAAEWQAKYDNAMRDLKQADAELCALRSRVAHSSSTALIRRLRRKLQQAREILVQLETTD